MELRPPQIIHTGKRPSDYEQMIDNAARNTHLGRRATALLKYYAGQANRFTPALAEITKHTGIPQNVIWNVRQEIIDRAMIAYEPQKSIVIVWDMIQDLAGLPEPLKMRGKKNSFNPEGNYSAWPMLDNKVGDIMDLYTVGSSDTPKANLSPEAEQIIHGIEKMTLREYHDFIHEFWGIKVVRENPDSEDIPMNYWYSDVIPADDNEEYPESAPLPF